MGTFPSVLKCRSLEATARTPPLQLPDRRRRRGRRRYSYQPRVCNNSFGSSLATSIPRIASPKSSQHSATTHLL